MPNPSARSRSQRLPLAAPPTLHAAFLDLVTALEAQAAEDIPQLARLGDCRRWYGSNPQLAWTCLVACLEAQLGHAITPH